MSPTKQVLVNEVFMSRPPSISKSDFWSFIIIFMWVRSQNLCVPLEKGELFWHTRPVKKHLGFPMGVPAPSDTPDMVFPGGRPPIWSPVVFVFVDLFVLLRFIGFWDLVFGRGR